MVSLIVLPRLRNHYYVMRHGQSLANSSGIIVSHPQNGLGNYGLSDSGRQQVNNAIGLSSLNSETRVFSSDFKRAVETADIVHRCLNCNLPVTFDERLRERNFGELELGPDSRYPEVWENDRHDTGPGYLDAESVYSVAKRASSIVLNCEKQFNSETCLLIAHGDILQILQTVFNGLPACQHRELPHLETAEIRLLETKS